jgi:hypothetical protein
VSRRITIVLLSVLVVLVTACRGAATALPPGSVPAAGDTALTATPGAGEATDQSGSVTAVTPGAGDQGALEGTVYGEGVTLTESTPISRIIDEIDDYVGQRVRVEGLVTAVCEMRGCWFEMASDREFETLRFKVEEGVIQFPVSIRGKYAVAEGIVVHVEDDGAEAARHATKQATEHGGQVGAGEGEGEMQPPIRLDGIGAVIRDHK